MRWNANVQVIWNVPSIENKRSSATEGFSNKFRNRKVISFVGGLMKEKGLRIALDACAIARGKHPEVLLLFMGLMKDRLTDIKGMIESKGIEDNVSFLPHLPYEEMLSYLRIAKAGLALYQPTYHYRELSSGNARKIFTYMQAGIPTIGPDFDEIGSVVKEEQCGILVDTTSPQEVAEAIIYLLDNAEHASAMGERGRKSILEKYNWEIEKKKFLSFIGRLDTTADCS
jgi:glycosyltransferase involved in cell wall biosynthesis